MRFSAKHLHSPDEQLHTLAGSFGYVAPEVLNKTGHGKAVDMWSTGYVLSLTLLLLGINILRQYHHLRVAMWLFSFPFRRYQRAHTRNNCRQD